MATCNYQGFLLQLAIGAPLFNASLGLYYALMIRKKWTDKMLARIELWVHTVIWTFAIGTSIVLLPLKQYNQIGQVCWIIGSPVDCGDSTHISNPEVPCERGDHAWLYGIFTFYGPLWVCVACCSYCMYLVYLEVSETMSRVRQYSFDERASRNIGRSEVNAVALQAILYTASFFITWMPSTLWSVAHWFRFSAFWLDFLSAFCEPLQGMWNFLIFIRSRRRTKWKILKAVFTIIPFVKVPPERDNVSSHNRSRNTQSPETSQLRASNLSDTAFYRESTLKASHMNDILRDNKSTSSVKFGFVDNGSTAMTMAPESSPADSGTGSHHSAVIIPAEEPAKLSRSVIKEEIDSSDGCEPVQALQSGVSGMDNTPKAAGPADVSVPEEELRQTVQP